MKDTIFAIATARGKSGVAIIRISGPEALSICEVFNLKKLTPRKAVLKNLIHEGEFIDQALVIFFPEGNSFTGENIIELHIHGSLAVSNKIINILINIDKFRIAEPGEFTRRAFINGVLDITQIEGLSDLIDAETEAQRRQAQRIFSGLIAKKGEIWRKSLIRVSALITSLIDFSDEEIPDNLIFEIRETIENLSKDMALEIESGISAERIRDGFEVALIGAPNVGKSSLLNHLAQRDVAITSSIAGTTRDVIELRMDIKGIPVTFLDTAGLRESNDEIEKIGIEKTKRRAKKADLRIHLIDPTDSQPLELYDDNDIVLRTKADIFPTLGQISSVNGLGVSDLLDKIFKKLNGLFLESGLLIRERHRLAVHQSIVSLGRALILLKTDDDLELAFDELRVAIQGIDVLIGRVDVESLLDEIFSSFCIGK